MKPESWEVEADEFLGTWDGSEYYRLGNEVYKSTDGSTRWFSTLPAFQMVVKSWEVSNDNG